MGKVMEELLHDKLIEQKQEGIKEGIKEGLKKGIKEGIKEGRIKLLAELVREGAMSISDAAKKMGLTETAFREIALL